MIAKNDLFALVSCWCKRARAALFRRIYEMLIFKLTTASKPARFWYAVPVTEHSTLLKKSKTETRTPGSGLFVHMRKSLMTVFNMRRA